MSAAAWRVSPGAALQGAVVVPGDKSVSHRVMLLGAILTKVAPALRELDMSYDFGTEVVPGPTPQAFLSKTVYRYRDGQ